MARISVAELYELMQAGAQPIIVDVRSPTARDARAALDTGRDSRPG